MSVQRISMITSTSVSPLNKVTLMVPTAGDSAVKVTVIMVGRGFSSLSWFTVAVNSGAVVPSPLGCTALVMSTLLLSNIFTSPSVVLSTSFAGSMHSGKQ